MRSARRFGTGLAGVAVLAAAVLFGFAGDAPGEVLTPPPSGPPANAPLAVVSMGDSTVSGEGAGDYDPATNGPHGDWCHRSANAEIHQVRLPGVVKSINLACSGADAAQVGLGPAVHYGERSQTAQLAALAKRDRVMAIVVAVGANNDPKFSQVVDACVKARFAGGSCSAGFEPQWQHRIDAMVPKVTKVLTDIRSTMARAGYPDGSYQLVLQSYSAPIGPDAAQDLLDLAGCPFQEADLRWVHDTSVNVLDAGLHRAADAAGTRFLDLSHAGLGHEACSGGSDPSTEWFTRLTIAWHDVTNTSRVTHATQESFHPNAKGHAAFANCLSQFLATTDRAATCLADTDGVLHPAALPAPN